MATKREIINDAFENIGFASYTYDIQPEQYKAALRRLDTMMADWSNRGIKLGYYPNTAGIDDAMQTPDAADTAIISNLAIRVAPTVGRAVPADVTKEAVSTFRHLANLAAAPQPALINADAVPAGAGNSGYNNDGFLDNGTYTANDITTIEQG